LVSRGFATRPQLERHDFMGSYLRDSTLDSRASLAVFLPLIFVRDSMKTIKISTLVFCVAFAGCASTVQKSEPTSTPPNSTAAKQATAEAPVAVAVKIPEASANRLVLNMSGSKTSTDSKDWGYFKDEWRAIFEQQTKAAGIQFEWQEGEARHSGQPGTLLAVNVNDYRVVGQGARIFFGIMTGNAYIDAQLRYMDLQNGAAFGAQGINTSSSAGHGIFATVTPKQIYAIADDVIRQMKAR
jgi:hypothetical protein